MKKTITMFFMLLALSCSSCGTNPTLSFDEVPLNDNSSKFTITSDLVQWSAVAGAVELGCHLAQLTVDRGYRYYYMDQKSRGTDSDRRPSFRLTFYNILPEGMSVANPMTAVAYKGEWGDDYTNGHGAMFYPDGTRYQGYWVAGKPHGHGVLISRSGDRYEGDWHNGRQHGHGVLISRNGERYEGDWHNGKQHGYGTMIYFNGVSYEGEWVNGDETGHGVFISEDGERYEGDFIDGAGTSSKGVYVTRDSLGIMYYDMNADTSNTQKERVFKEADDILISSAFDAKADGFLDLCKEAKSRISKQQKIYLDLSPK